jgi:uncharacterized membrane protein
MITPSMPPLPSMPPIWPFNWHRAQKKSLSRGDRMADQVRNGMGSWAFVFTFVGFMAIWAALNTIGAFHHWDEYPFILLNLFLSMLAALQGAILLIAAKRADAVSAAMAQHDYQTNIQSKKYIEELIEINTKQLRMIEELHAELRASKKR